MIAAKDQIGTARRRSSSTIELVDMDEPAESPNAAASKAAWTPWGSSDPGALDLRVLDQGQWWVDITGTPHRLAFERGLHEVIGTVMIARHRHGHPPQRRGGRHHEAGELCFDVLVHSHLLYHYTQLMLRPVGSTLARCFSDSR